MLKWLAVSSLIVVVDQITKLIANHALSLYQAYPVLPSLNLTLMYNKGAAFSFLSEAGGWQRWFFTVLAVVVSIVIVIWIRRLPARETWMAAGLSLVLGGAIGNVIDRITYGHVIDFIDVYYASYHWPAFNVADSAITVGATILVVHALFFHKPQTGESH